jgi:hypothetical protein
MSVRNSSRAYALHRTTSQLKPLSSRFSASRLREDAALAPGMDLTQFAWSPPGQLHCPDLTRWQFYMKSEPRNVWNSRCAAKFWNIWAKGKQVDENHLQSGHGQHGSHGFTLRIKYESLATDVRLARRPPFRDNRNFHVRSASRHLPVI